MSPPKANREHRQTLAEYEAAFIKWATDRVEGVQGLLNLIDDQWPLPDGWAFMPDGYAKQRDKIHLAAGALVAFDDDRPLPVEFWISAGKNPPDGPTRILDAPWPSRLVALHDRLNALAEVAANAFGEVMRSQNPEADNIGALPALRQARDGVLNELRRLRTGDDDADDTTPAEDAPSKSRRTSANTRMIETIQKRPESRDWTAKQWAEALECAPSTIKETATWKDLVKVRAVAKAERRNRG